MLLTSGYGYSQQVSAVADREKILLGEQIKLTLRSDNVPGITQWFMLPDSVNHIEVVERSKIDTIAVESIQRYEQVITLTSFDSGRWQLPALRLTTNKGTLATQPIAIEVLPVDVSQMQDYHDIKEIIEVAPENNWLSLIIIIALTLLSLGALYYFMQRKRATMISRPVLDGNLTPLQWALRELEKLQQENLSAGQAIKTYYQRLTNISRQYFYLQLQHKALHQTTSEWMLQLQPLPVRQDAKIAFLQLLRLADTVKFARYLPPTEENSSALQVARQMFEQVAAWKNSTTSPVNKGN
jgi:hypothetical protein